YKFGLNTGLSFLGEVSDLTMNNLTIKATAPGNASVIGALFHGSEESSVRINDVDISLTGGESTNMYGLQGVNAKDIVLNTLNVQTQGGDRVELLRSANARILGDVTLGSQQGLASAKGDLLAIYGSVDISNNNKFMAWGDIHSE
ncbi:autotransporter outer membrane beta-barrel domain-containing protein, partial [Salmonella enterica subsp. enterica serovar Kentucky]|nr:autotransporter outer membrane beta-barrel domain-containing protein [Salmonella enterica subsp. enterica serovar Kentucky]